LGLVKIKAFYQTFLTELSVFLNKKEILKAVTLQGNISDMKRSVLLHKYLILSWMRFPPILSKLEMKLFGQNITKVRVVPII